MYSSIGRRGFRSRRCPRCRKSLGQKITSGVDSSNDSVACVGIEFFAVPVECQLETAVFDVWNGVGAVLVGDIDPGGHERRREAAIAFRRAEEKNFLARDSNPAAQNFGEDLRQPRPASVTWCRRVVARNSASSTNSRLPEQPGDYRLHRTPRQDHACLGLIQAFALLSKSELRKRARKVLGCESLELDAAFLIQPVARATRIARRRCPEHAGIVEQFGPPGLLEQFQPQFARPHGPARVDLIRAITGAQDPCFTAGT